jgi:hypothetical protein
VNDTISRKIVQHSISPSLSEELRQLLVASTHRIAKIRELAMKYLQRLITAFPSLLCDPPFIVALLEVLTLMYRACEGELTDEVSPCFPADLCGLISMMPSLHHNTSIAHREPISSLSFRIHTHRGTKYCPSCTGTPTNGWKQLQLEHRLRYRLRFRSVDSHSTTH